MIAAAVTFTAMRFDFVLSSLGNELAARLGESSTARTSSAIGQTLRDTAFLVFGALLVACHPKRSGISLGTTTHRRNAFAVCAVVIGGALAYRFVFNGDAFNDWNATWSTWLISPIAQELVFSGFILGLLNEQFPRRWHPSVPITTGVAISALLFGLWHFIPDFAFAQRDLDYVAFRFIYTAGGWMLYAITRIWTGTILYAIAMHITVNFIALGHL
jgi:membrane protease YdiL (CAAX protease family)